jgi:hypothetical protein
MALTSIAVANRGAVRPGGRLSWGWLWIFGLPVLRRPGPAWRIGSRQRLVLLVAAGVLLLALPDSARGLRELLGAAEVVRNGPASIAAMVWGVAHSGHLGVRHGMLVITGMRGGARLGGGTTIGSVYLTEADHVDRQLLDHERHHVDQWALFGPVGFPLAYGAAELVGRTVLHAPQGAGNIFEMQAGLREGGYQPPTGRMATDLVLWLSPHPAAPGPPPPMTLRTEGAHPT